MRHKHLHTLTPKQQVTRQFDDDMHDNQQDTIYLLFAVRFLN